MKKKRGAAAMGQTDKPAEKRAAQAHAGREMAKRLALVILASVLMAMNIKSFVEAGGLFPGGFNGLTLLIQRSAQQFAGITLSFTLINFLLNAVPAVISFRLIGKRFTIYSCLMIVLTSVLTDLIPSMPLTNDVLLVCIFGGLINGFAISLCLLGRATSGGTDFIAVALSERLNIDAWNYILVGNAVMLGIAGVLFGWDKALYSIIFQFASTQVVHMINPRYKRTTLFIISDRAAQVYENIKDTTHHGATLFRGTGLYNGTERDMIYSVISGDQVKRITKQVREIDPHAFINILKTDQVAGNFYQRPHD
ncbi:YitT family protein [Butyricicoccus faecihominis]|uniref:YitT family protein n=1 Tax=Butyricicoccus faecihominis TaxID=1712515 RepID=UPI0024784ECD|nr:YitT family protein [Butyricicoccus faecihominis]MCQ5128472.1 YitT family protein [Butyricicoccus faecihominis]